MGQRAELEGLPMDCGAHWSRGCRRPSARYDVPLQSLAYCAVCDLHGFAKIGRDTAEDLLAGHVDVKKWREDLLPKRDRDPYHKWHLRAKIVVIIAAAVTGAVILWRTHYPVALSQPEVFLGV